MIRNRWLVGAVVVPVGLLAVGCGGSVDLESPKAAGGSAPMGGAGTTQTMGGRPSDIEDEPSDGGAPLAAGGKAPVAGSSTGGAPNDPEQRIAWLVLDAQPEGEQRGVYLLSAQEFGSCSTRLSPAEQTAKQPAFSDDGKLVAYVADTDGTDQIYVFDLNSGESEQVTDLAQGASYPTFAPSGLQLAFVTGDAEGLRDGLIEDAPDIGDLMLVDLKSHVTQTVRPREQGDQFPYFSPVFVGPDRIYMANTYGMLQVQLDGGTPVSVLVTPSPSLAQDPAPSPDGRFVAHSESCSNELDIYMLRVGEGVTHSCTPPTRDVSHELGYVSADWGSYGFIAAEIYAPAHGVRLLDELDLRAGQGLVTPPLARNPDWSPAGFQRACQQ
jgi:hypothetical protein